MHLPSRFHLVPAFLLLSLMALPGAAAARNTPLVVSGVVQSGSDPVACSRVRVFEAHHRYGRARSLGARPCNPAGHFSVRLAKTPAAEAILYLVADAVPEGASRGRGGARVVRLAAMLGSAPRPDPVVINERTTVATAYALAQFIDGDRIGGPAPGLHNAAATAANLANVATGGVGATLGAPPNGNLTSALPTFNSLANLLAGCVRDAANCPGLFDAATLEGMRPRNTLDAMVQIAHAPGSNVGPLLDAAQTAPVYGPALPDDADTDRNDPNFINSWVLGLRYVGGGPDGQFMDGPGNIAFDSKGNAWVSNNYAFGDDPSEIRCGSTQVMKLTPTGGSPPGAPYGGDDTVLDGAGAGGLYGAGFGMAVDQNDSAWVTNFGFQGQLPAGDDSQPPCPIDADALSVSVSQFAADGAPISPDGDPSANVPGGYRVLGQDVPNGPLVDLLGQPQGVLADGLGNIWVAGCIDGTIARFRGGDPGAIDFLDVEGLDKGFDVAVDQRNHVFMTGNGTDNVVEMSPDFQQVGDLIPGFRKPMGIATDSRGNLWVSEAGITNPPCPALLEGPGDDLGGDGSDNLRARVGLIRTLGGERIVRHFGKNLPGEPTRDGLRWPWGISVDGSDNVWVANFAGQTIMHLCGARPATCPEGVGTGDPISPDSGYFNNALTRVTAAQVDPSGNVWLTNNWILDAFANPENPGGHQVVVFIGLATPVKTPLIGVPSKP